MTDTLRFDLDVVLPDAHDARDHCVDDLLTMVRGLDGVQSVHVLDDAPSPQVCVHVQRGAVGLRRLEERVRAAGAEIGDRYGHLLVDGVPAGHTGRAAALTERVRSLPGVVDAAVTVEGVARIEYDRTLTSETLLRRALPGIGVRLDAAHADHDHDEAAGDAHGHAHGHGARRAELVAAFVSLALYLIGRSLDWFTDLETPVVVLYMLAAVVTGVFVAQDAVLSARTRVFDIDQLMLVAAIGAACIGQWGDSALLLVLFSLGHALEGYAMGRARHAIESLAELAPATARRRDEPAIDVPVEDLLVGDVVIVRPGERVPADGIVVGGLASIDESAITGESMPVDKLTTPEAQARVADFATLNGDRRIFAGSLNGASAIDVLVRRPASDSTLARVVQLVAEAETQTSPSQRLTRRIVRVFVPAVLALVALLLVLPPLAGEPFRESFARAMAVLVAASPCALAIATPSAVLAAIAGAARQGVLVKGGGPLETLGRVTVMAFDKTGTLTEGKPRLTDVETASGVDRQDLLRVVLAVESESDHPLARAIVAAASAEVDAARLSRATAVIAEHGKGVVGEFEGRRVMIGNPALFADHDLPDELLDRRDALEGSGRTTVLVRSGDRWLGVLGLMDTPRPESAATIVALRRAGIEKLVMLSGDSQGVASAIAGQVGIDDARGGLFPADKVAAVDALAATATLAMVGDGVNDAPALAAADVGIAMGAAGSDVALETADIALMSDRLELLPAAVELSRRASRTITQNLAFSLGVVAVLIPLTMLGVGISFAVIAHEGSTLVVVLNALRLLRDR